MAIIAIDFDQTLVLGDKALPGAKEAINLLREKGHKVVIHSCNTAKWIEQVLNNNDIRFDAIATNSDCLNGKYNADLFVDDKGYFFQGNWSMEVKELLARVEGQDNRRW